MGERQEMLDAFYAKHGPCCAGCDWWRHVNSRVGECRRTAPLRSNERWAMLGMSNITLEPASGHIMTPRDHHCGDFKDEFDWTSLPPHYLRQIGMTNA